MWKACYQCTRNNWLRETCQLPYTEYEYCNFYPPSLSLSHCTFVTSFSSRLVSSLLLHLTRSPVSRFFLPLYTVKASSIHFHKKKRKKSANLRVSIGHLTRTIDLSIGWKSKNITIQLWTGKHMSDLLTHSFTEFLSLTRKRIIFYFIATAFNVQWVWECERREEKREKN